MMAMLLLLLGVWMWAPRLAEYYPRVVLVPAGVSDGLDASGPGVLFAEDEDSVDIYGSEGSVEFDAGDPQDVQGLEDFSEFDVDGSQDVDPDEAHGGLRRRGWPSQGRK